MGFGAAVPFLTFSDCLFDLFGPFFVDLSHLFIDLSHSFIDLWLIPPPAGGGNRTCDLVVESRVRDHWAIPVIPSLPSHHTPCHVSLFFGHHEGPYKRWSFLNPCIFRLISTHSSLFVVQHIGFGASGPFGTFFYPFVDVTNVRFDQNEILVR